MTHRNKEITRISDKNKRHVSFSKRKGGLFKKAGKLASLTGAEVGIMIISEGGRLFTYGSPSIDDIITKYLQGPQLLNESHRKHLQCLSTLHSKIQSQFEDATELFNDLQTLKEKWVKLDMHSKDIFEMEIQELKEYVSFLQVLREKAFMLPENGDNNVNLDCVESSCQTLYQENSHEDLTSTSSLPKHLIHQQRVKDMNIHLCSGEFGPKHLYPEYENVEMGCSFGLSEVSDLDHHGSINAMNVCFSNGECGPLFLCPQDEGIEISSSLDLSETCDWNHLGSIKYMNSFLCNGEFRPKNLYPQDENFEMGCSFGLSEISDLNHHGSINGMNVCFSNGEYEPPFMCSEDEGIGMSNSLGLSGIVAGII
ncbi:agamous-like MADS-box protein AGL62 [Amborella trichopoda]|uniref:MADS-box domain-containing protein n=1 Tax=Amborella trichopoda TaxID=13333 RepID=W1PAQ9_AMBTC|nr:agamous-like MADS-box protein AGL62 [Amborella trichopoda]ERN04769.1 hypothetical protein AMTR_s00140p00045380 [Amborella trichopoda]|eukprot:XP_020522127.1 agamous-like MADS-box protein AGL62 [Amborella trichopoda]